MARSLRRREFLTSTMLSAGCFVAERAVAQPSRSANEKLNFACIGVGGRGAANTDDAGRNGNIIALCDIDDTRMEPKAKQYPNAKKYFSFNQMFDEKAKEIDAVVISTPDHTHAAAALKAMRLGKHVYCEKPLARYVGEARRVAEVAQQMNVVTQMGNQGTAHPSFRKTLEALRSGLIGTIREVHAWSGSNNLPAGPDARPKTGGNPPPFIHWNEFLGPAEQYAYSADYHAGHWVGWWAFGTGPIGALSCHVLNLAFHAADLRNPTTIVAEHTGHNRIAYPKSSSVRWDFAATGKRPPLTLFWYDGGRKPDSKLFDGEPISKDGCLIVGDNGKLVSKDDFMNTRWMLLPERQLFTPDSRYDYYLPETSNHFREFVDAIQSGGTTMSNFTDVGGPMTETLMLGNLAIWADKKIEWDATSLSVKNQPDLASAITPKYRAGYTF